MHQNSVKVHTAIHCSPLYCPLTYFLTVHASDSNFGGGRRCESNKSKSPGAVRSSVFSHIDSFNLATVQESTLQIVGLGTGNAINP